MSLTLSGITLGNILGGPTSLTLGNLADVSISNPVTAEYLRYNGSISKWQNVSLDPDVFSFINQNFSSAQGVVITSVPGPNSVTIGLGNITPASVSASGTVTGSNLSGTNTGDQTITLTGDVTGSGTGSFSTTLVTVNSTPGTYGSSVSVPQITVDSKGRIISVVNVPVSGGGGGGGSGTVTSVAATGNNGITVSGSPITSSGTIVLGLGNITPVSVAASGSITGLNLSGTNTGDQTITLTGDVTGSGAGTFAATLATVNSSPVSAAFQKITVNGKGLVTATSAVTSSDITDALGYIPAPTTGGVLTVDELNISSTVSMDEDTITTSSTTPDQVVSITSAAVYRSVKYLVQASSGIEYQVSEINLIHNGTTAFITEYGTVFTDNRIAIFDADISGSSLRLLVTPINPVTTIKLLRISLSI